MYQIAEHGFTLSYPASWRLKKMVLGSRASGAQFYAGEEPVFSATVYRWDPKNDLNAYLEQRRLGWSSPGHGAVGRRVAAGRRAKGVGVDIQGAVGTIIYSLPTEMGEMYLELLSTEDRLLLEIAGTLRSDGPQS